MGFTEPDQVFKLSAKLLDKFAILVASYLAFWTLVPERTLYFALIWYSIWNRYARGPSDIRILVAGLLQALLYRGFHLIFSCLASCIIVIAVCPSYILPDLYPAILLTVYANYILVN